MLFPHNRSGDVSFPINSNGFAAKLDFLPDKEEDFPDGGTKRVKEEEVEEEEEEDYDDDYDGQEQEEEEMMEGRHGHRDRDRKSES